MRRFHLSAGMLPDNLRKQRLRDMRAMAREKRDTGRIKQLDDKKNVNK